MTFPISRLFIQSSNYLTPNTLRPLYL